MTRRQANMPPIAPITRARSRTPKPNLLAFACLILEIWDKLIVKNPNIRFVLCGHMHDQARLTSTRQSAPPVYQLLADYQNESLGGAGFLRLMTFAPDGSVDVTTYSPYLQELRDNPNDAFVLAL